MTEQVQEDWDYIKSCSLKGKFDDPFVTTIEKVLATKLLWKIVDELKADDQIRLLPKLKRDFAGLSYIDPPLDRGKIRIFRGWGTIRNKFLRVSYGGL